MLFTSCLMATCLLVNGAVVNRKITDSYQNIPIESDNIKENLIQDEDAGDIVGLLPPKPDAEDYFPAPENFFRESSYAMDSDSKSIKLKGEPRKDEELTEEEQAAIKEIQGAFAKLMEEAKAGRTSSDDPFRPLVTMSDDGVAVEMAAVDLKGDQYNVREGEPEVTTLPDGELESFTTDVSDEDSRREQEAGLLDFLQSMWDVVQDSVSYAARLLTGRIQNPEVSTASPEESTAVPSEASSTTSSPSEASSVGTIFAVEEPLARHVLPAHESEGRRDIDSLLYGRGIA